MPPKSLDGAKLKVGDFLSRVSYMKVVSISGDSVEVENKGGFRWSISKSILEAESTSSTQFVETRRVTRTELARILEQDVRDSVFSVAFTKLPDPNDQEKLLADADLSTPAKRKRVAKDISVGKERVLPGHISDTHELGRMVTYDLEAKGERLVDLRTLKYIIFNNVKHEVK
jgi:hypothetical protein